MKDELGIGNQSYARDNLQRVHTIYEINVFIDSRDGMDQVLLGADENPTFLATCNKL